MKAYMGAMKAVAVVVVSWLVATAGPPALHASDEPVALPPHDYVLVDDAAAAQPALLIGRVREALQRAITEAGLAGPGYPRPCHVTRTPDPGRPGWYDVACVPGVENPAPPDGILFDETGRFLQLSVVDFPDSRPYLMEIFVVPRFPYPNLRTDERWVIPRIAVHHPLVSSSWHPTIWEALEHGVRSLGVSVLEK